METYQKQAWELITGEHVVVYGLVWKVLRHTRDIRLGIGAIVDLSLSGVNEHGRAVVMSIGIKPHKDMTCVSRKVHVVADSERLDKLRTLLDTASDSRGITWWEWIDGGLGGSLYGQMREILG